MGTILLAMVPKLNSLFHDFTTLVNFSNNHKFCRVGSTVLLDENIQNIDFKQYYLVRNFIPQKKKNEISNRLKYKILPNTNVIESNNCKCFVCFTKKEYIYVDPLYIVLFHIKVTSFYLKYYK